MMHALVAAGLLCGFGLTLRFIRQATMLWILAMETSPDSWLDNLIGGHETIIGVMKGLGLVLVAVIGLRCGWRRDRFNPGFAFGAMFLVGLMHGLYPGLTLLASLRSLIGSAGPFMFSFVRLPPAIIQAMKRAAIFGPLVTVGFGGLLALAGLDQMYGVEQGALRLGASGEAPFLAGFALIGVYAGLMAFLRAPRRREAIMLGVNLTIILLTGARTPLALALLVTVAVLFTQRRLIGLAFFGALAASGVLFFSALSFLRVFDLVKLGEASDLSNRDLVWPYFMSAFSASPFFGWGVGAGKEIIPVTSRLTSLIGTNAAHDEYLRIGSEGGMFGLLLLIALMFLWLIRGSAGMARPERWFIRFVFIAFALHSMTDNTLIATTSSVFFMWISAVFATGDTEAAVGQAGLKGG
jgi:O-antigen ligase